MQAYRRVVTVIAALAVVGALTLHQPPALAVGCPGGMSGSGTSDEPCLITDQSELASIDESPAALQLDYRLENDITLAGTWTPLAPYGGPVFEGVLDGNGKTISRLQTTDTDALFVGLFGATSGASFRNLRLAEVNVVGAGAVGALAGVSDATTIEKVSISGSVRAETQAAGGIIGYTASLTGDPTAGGPTTISQSQARDITVTTGASGMGAGGMVGASLQAVTISNSLVSGSVTASDQVGGFGGYPGVTIIDSVSTTTLTVDSSGTKGGLLPGGVDVATRTYFDATAAGTTNAGAVGGVAKTPTQLRQLATYSGWDIGADWDPSADIWGICQSPNVATVPFLNWTFASSPCAPPRTIPPTVTTGTASSITANEATVGATVNGNDNLTTIEIFTTTSAANAAARIGTSNATTPSTADGDTDTAVEVALTRLQPNTTYYFWASATNPWGTSVGTVSDFTTTDGPPPLFECTSYAWPGGIGTTADPYLVDDYIDLYQATQCPASSFRQRANISLAPIDDWIPIGDLSTPFSGTYDGGRYQITDLSYSSVTGDYVGLFGVTNGATIRNINALTGSVLGRTSVGGLVGRATNTTVTDVHTSVTVTGDPSSPAAGSSAAYYIGGLVGWMNAGTITGSSSSADVTATGDGGSTGNFIGGLVGYGADVTITNSWASGNVFGIMYTGGLVGEVLGSSTVTRSNATGDVGGAGTGTAGGLIGQVEGAPTVADVFATGNVTTTRGGVANGGLFGFVRGGTIMRAYSTGAISATGASVSAGGLIGAVPTSGTLPTFTASLWDTQTSGLTDATGAGALSGVTGETTMQMQTLSTFIDEGWDISESCATTADTVWTLCPTENDGYPLLPREPAPDPTPEPTPDPTPSWPSNSTPGSTPNVDTAGGQASTSDSAASPAPPPIAPARTLRPGRTFATMDGAPIRIAVTSAVNGNSLSLTGPGFTTDFGGVFRPVSGTKDDAVQPVLLPGRTVRVGGGGAAPGSTVAIYLFSDPTTLTEMAADSTGAFEGEFRLPTRTPKGNHALQVAMNTGKLVNASVGVTVAKAAQRTSTTQVRFSGSKVGLSKAARAQLRKFAAPLRKNRDVGITCVASLRRGTASHAKEQLAHTRSTRVCDFLADQSIPDLDSLKATVSPSKQGRAGLVRVVATSTIS